MLNPNSESSSVRGDIVGVECDPKKKTFSLSLRASDILNGDTLHLLGVLQTSDNLKEDTLHLFASLGVSDILNEETLHLLCLMNLPTRRGVVPLLLSEFTSLLLSIEELVLGESNTRLGVLILSLSSIRKSTVVSSALRNARLASTTPVSFRLLRVFSLDATGFVM